MFVDLKFSIFKIQVSDYMNSKKNSAFQFSVSDFHLDTSGLTEHITGLNGVLLCHEGEF